MSEGYEDTSDAPDRFDGEGPSQHESGLDPDTSPQSDQSQELIDRATAASNALFPEYYDPANPLGLFHLEGGDAVSNHSGLLQGSIEFGYHASSPELRASELPSGAAPLQGERASAWMTNAGDERGSQLPTPLDFMAGVGDMVANYFELRQANADFNLKGMDKYFHCKANCEAGERGIGGLVAGVLISTAREAVDLPKNVVVKGMTWRDSAADCGEDMRANRTGWEGALGGIRCSSACETYRPKGY